MTRHTSSHCITIQKKEILTLFGMLQQVTHWKYALSAVLSITDPIPRQITMTGKYVIIFIIIERLERDIISTRTNIQSLLGGHEYHGHYKNNWKHKKNSFDPTYHYQTRTMKRRFMKTTHKFREYVKSVIKENKYGL